MDVGDEDGRRSRAGWFVGVGRCRWMVRPLPSWRLKVTKVRVFVCVERRRRRNMAGCAGVTAQAAKTAAISQPNPPPPISNHERLQNPSSNPSTSRTRRIISFVVVVAVVAVANLASALFSLPLIVVVPNLDVVAATPSRRRLERHPMLLAHRSHQQGCQYERSIGCVCHDF